VNATGKKRIEVVCLESATAGIDFYFVQFIVNAF